MDDSQNTLKWAAWLLILLGTFETALLGYAIATGGSFSGGSVLYIVAGIFLLRKNRTDYKIVQFYFTAFFSLLPALLLFLAVTAVQLHTATTIPLSWRMPWPAMALGVVYGLAVLALVALLHHPGTREALSLQPYRASVRTLYMPRLRFALLFCFSIAFVSLLAGPYLLTNPYKAITAELAASPAVVQAVGQVKRLELLSTMEQNWHVVSYWKVVGTKGQDRYKTELTSGTAVAVEAYGRKKNCVPEATPKSAGKKQVAS